MLIEAIIFDKDGVLADSEKLKAHAWQRTLQAYGVDQGSDWYLGNLGPPAVVLSEMAIATFRFQADPQEVANAWHAEYRATEHSTEPITANLQCLRQLARKYPIAIASSMDKATIESEMERFGYLQHISFALWRRRANNKPAPRCLSGGRYSPECHTIALCSHRGFSDWHSCRQDRRHALHCLQESTVLPGSIDSRHIDNRFKHRKTLVALISHPDLHQGIVR